MYVHPLFALPLRSTANRPFQWGSIESNGIVQKLIYLQSERRFIQPSNTLNDVSRRKIALYVGLQIFGVAATVAISQTIAAIGFPVLIIALIPLRVVLMPKWFTNRELCVLDDLTAHHKEVLGSLGGRPNRMRGLTADDGDNESEDTSDSGNKEGGVGTGLDEEQRDLSRHRSRSAVRQRVGSITRQTMHRIRSDENEKVVGTGADPHASGEEQVEPSEARNRAATRQRAGSISR